MDWEIVPEPAALRVTDVEPATELLRLILLAAISVTAEPDKGESTSMPPLFPVAESDNVPEEVTGADAVISAATVDGAKLFVTLTALPVEDAVIFNGPLV